MPIDRGIIDQQLQALRESSHWWEQREMRDLPAVMHADETMLAISRGKIGRPRFLRRPWLIVVTDRRLLCLRSAVGSGWRQLEVPAEQITRVALRVGAFRGRVIVVAGAQTYRLLVRRPDAYKVMSAISSLGKPSNEAVFGFAPTRVVRRVMDHMLALPAVALNPLEPKPESPRRNEQPKNDERVQALEDEIEQLRQQVQFLEDLLRQRQPALTSSEHRQEE